MHWDWFAIFALVVAVFFLRELGAKLDKIASLLGRLIDYQAQSASSLRSAEHDIGVLRDRATPATDLWDDDFIASHSDRPQA
jgi:hypothetical protein